MPIFPSVNTAGEFESPAVQQAVKNLAKEEDESLIQIDTTAGTKVTIDGVVVHYDSGWRNISDLMSPGWTLLDSSSSILIRRVNATVDIQIRGVVPDGSSVQLFAIPTGFRERNGRIPALAYVGVGTEVLYSRIVSSYYQINTSVKAGEWRDGNATFMTRDPFPTILPGTSG